MSQRIILDTGVLVAYFRKSDRFHQWAVTQWRQVDLPVFTCDAVISEACFLFRDLPHIQRAIVELIEGNVIKIAFNLQEESGNIRVLMGRYESVPMSFADACLVRMAEPIAKTRLNSICRENNSIDLSTKKLVKYRNAIGQDIMKVAIDRYIEVTPDVRGGKPRIAGRRITIADVAIAYLRLGQTLEEVAAEYDLTLAEVYAAMSFYYDNKVAIDESIQVSEAFADSLRPMYPSLLQEKIYDHA